ncbi:ABC transporter ATP-binding protein [Azospirillum sp. RWY-5-1]|uniref:ABC transporter ATP-binding protein n=1 Tax=Azospirillum oleiclasticum TaxID=2735135 RepID=A0ABX2TAE7_9PROT|nr:ATP-binding cassette domain-containing protein [Azospirillum oleiclasticum]NYZ13209.1 ABC transporter ATP-binding protein [Azospirillum oleiclasticum]NYZ20118.1 ABC transporter ATP-binding protein [Azospirillum oleiclasticum]
MTAGLTVTGLTVGCGTRALVDRVGLEVAPGEVVALLGPAGSGKSLLLRALAGLPPPGVWVEGAAALDGRALTGGGEAPENPGPGFVLIPERASAALVQHRSLADLFAEALAIGGHGTTIVPVLQQAASLLERMGMTGASRRLALHPSDLSDGALWRAALALALAAGPRLVLADAPADGLDPSVRAAMLDRLAVWARETGAALLIAGRPDAGLDVAACRVLHLEHGRLVPEPQPRPRPVAADAAPAGPPVLSVRDLAVSFPVGPTRMTVLEGAGFELAEGDTLALLGESGSGKSIFARALLRLVPASAGQVTWRGRDLLSCDDATMRGLRREMQMLFPDARSAFDPLRTIGDHIAESLAALRPDIPKAERSTFVTNVLRKVGLPSSVADCRIGALTAAEAARAALARALAPEPRLLVCDEPLSRLDGDDRAAFLDRLLELRRDEHLTLVYATQDADQALRVGRRVLVMMTGRPVELAPAGTLPRDAHHPYTRAMLAAARASGPFLDGDPVPAVLVRGGCGLRARCAKARPFCASSVPTLEPVGPGHRVSCHYWDLPDGHGDPG